MLCWSLWATECWWNAESVRYEHICHDPEERYHPLPSTAETNMPRFTLQKRFTSCMNSNNWSAHRKLKPPCSVGIIGLPFGNLAAGGEFPNKWKVIFIHNSELQSTNVTVWAYIWSGIKYLSWKFLIFMWNENACKSANMRLYEDTTYNVVLFTPYPSKSVGKINARQADFLSINLGWINWDLSIRPILEKCYEKGVFVAIRSRIH